MLNPLLFIAVLDLISRKTVMKDAMKKLLYADDMALVANGIQELHETMGTKNSKSNEGRQARRMVELREETGVQRSLTEILVRSRLQWAGHVNGWWMKTTE